MEAFPASRGVGDAVGNPLAAGAADGDTVVALLAGATEGAAVVLAAVAAGEGAEVVSTGEAVPLLSPADSISHT